jgi:predicted NBD/HSP70 family sugar kinase
MTGDPGTRATPPLLKRLNLRTVLEAVRADAPISRAEISRRAGISKPTVSLALQSLLEAGLVRESRHRPDGPSFGAVFFEPVPDAALVLGLDLGARFARGAICDLTGAVRVRQDVELTGPSSEAAIAAIESVTSSLIEDTDAAERISSVVIGVPGVVDAGGRLNLTHFLELEGIALGDDLERRLGLDVTLMNDVNLAALGEEWQGVARGVDDFAFLSIGTGLGMGLVLGGELHSGHHGAAGELDHALGFGSDPSANAVSSYAAELAAAPGAATSLAPPFEPREVFTAARRGDPLAQAVVAEVARRIALHIAPVAAVADVGLVVLGGGIGANGDLLLEPIRGMLAEWLPYPPRLEISSLGEAAVLYGALAIGLRTALDDVFVNRAPGLHAETGPLRLTP